MNAKIKDQYYWVIAVVAVLEMSVSGGILNSIGGLFLIPVTETLGITRGEFSLAGGLQSLVGFGLSLISGIMFMKFGYRKLVTMCLLLTAGGMCIMSGSQNLAMLCIGSVLVGTCNAFCTTIGSARLVGNWFHKHHGLILGIVTAFSGIGGSIFSLILSGSIAKSGWRNAYSLTAAFFAVTALMVFLLIRSRPQDMELKPYGEGYMPKRKNKPQKVNDHWAGFSFEQLKKKPIFYLTILGTFLSCVCPYMVYSVVAPYVQDCGMGAAFGAKVQSIVMFALAAAKLGFGFLSDRIGAKATTMISLTACSISLVLFATATGPVSMCVAAVIFAVGLTLTGIVAPLLTPVLLGYQSGGKAMGIVLSMAPAASMVASPLCNSLRDSIGSYVPVFWGTAVVSVAVIALYFVLYAMSDKDRKEYEETNEKEVCEPL